MKANQMRDHYLGEPLSIWLGVCAQNWVYARSTGAFATIPQATQPCLLYWGMCLQGAAEVLYSTLQTCLPFTHI